MEISVFGLGYVGIVSSVSLARRGHQVVGVDVEPRKVEMVMQGVSPLAEPGVARLLKRARGQDRLRATTDAAAAVAASDISLICVGTPSRPDGGPSVDQVLRVAGEIGEALRAKRSYHGIVIRSTAIPGTADRVAQVVERASGKAPEADFGVAANPEFMREGSSIKDFEHPPYTVVGTSDLRLAEMLADMYAGVRAPLYRVGTREAEMLKYAANAFHAVKVTFANEIGAIGKRLGIASHKVMELLVEDTKLNMSGAYLEPGFAFGGSCLPKDLRAIIHEARRLDLAVPMLAAVPVSNDEQIERVVRWVLNEQRERIGVLGLSFKSDTDDLRESPIMRVVAALLDQGCDVVIYDANVDLAQLRGANRSAMERQIPHLSVLMRGSIREVLDHAEILLIANRGAGFREALGALRPDQKVYDLVRILDEPELCDERYQGICW